MERIYIGFWINSTVPQGRGKVYVNPDREGTDTFLTTEDWTPVRLAHRHQVSAIGAALASIYEHLAQVGYTGPASGQAGTLTARQELQAVLPLLDPHGENGGDQRDSATPPRWEALWGLEPTDG